MKLKKSGVEFHGMDYDLIKRHLEMHLEKNPVLPMGVDVKGKHTTIYKVKKSNAREARVVVYLNNTKYREC